MGLLLRPVRGQIVLATVLEVVAGLATLVPLVAIYWLARELLAPTPRPAVVWTIVATAAGAVIVRFLSHGAAIAVSHNADLALQLRLRREMAAHLARVPLGWISDRNSGRVKNALQDDVEQLHYMVAHALPDFVVAISTPLAAVVYLMTINAPLTLLIVLVIPLFMVSFRVMSRVAGSRMGEIGAAMGRLNSAVVEFVQGIAVVKAFGQGRRARDRFAAAADDYLTVFGSINKPIIRMQSLSTALISPAVMLVVVTAAGAGFVGLGWLEPVEVVPFLTLGLGLTAPVLTLGMSMHSFHTAGEAAKRVGELLATATMAEPVAPVRPVGHRVEFDQVSFGYDPAEPVLRDVTAVLEPGTVTALVGPSGAGKSTLATLVPRFYDPDSGTVRLGGVDVRDIAAGELYRQVGFVFQQVQLLHTSVAENLRLARPEATTAELEAACRAAHIHDRIMALPRGYDSVIDEDAIFSGGEAQRLSIARALLADTPVLVLDEATAYADAQSEAEIQDALSELVAGRTVLVIAHRLATIVDADQILVLDHGAVVERGTHAQLLATGGLYRQMWSVHEAAGPPADRSAPHQATETMEVAR
jgi:ATP-binding cassette subfamily B protein